jgi:hypothetical protein
MKGTITALLQTTWISPEGWELGLPEQCEIEIPDVTWNTGDQLDLPEGRKAFVKNRRMGVLVFVERRVHVPMAVPA